MPAQSVHRNYQKSREALLADIAGLPSSAFIPTAQAAAYLGSTPGVLLNWRSQRRGPRYHGKNDFVRYRIADLDLWMSSRSDEVRTEEYGTGGDCGRRDAISPAANIDVPVIAPPAGASS